MYPTRRRSTTRILPRQPWFMVSQRDWRVDAPQLRVDLVADFDDQFYFDSDIEWQRPHAHR